MAPLQTRYTARELIAVAERAAPRLDWKSRYVDLIATAINAVAELTGAGDDGTIDISPPKVISVADRLVAPVGN